MSDCPPIARRRGVTHVATLLVLASACSGQASDRSATPFLSEPTGSTFERIDSDGDGELGLEEFHEGLAFHYYYRRGLDLDGDRVIEDVELTTALFEMWDRDKDRSLSPEELRSGLSMWFPDRSETVRFAQWDLDGNGALSIVEFGEGTVSSTLYDAYDLNQDGVIETPEASGYLHDQWDENGDGLVESGEWPLP